MAKFKYQPDQKFGLWTLKAFSPTDKKWWAVCQCGHEKMVYIDHLTSGRSTSCGLCGVTRGSHGGTDTPEYRTWGSMRARCNNPNNDRYHRYGGRGISVAPRWDNFENFLADMGPRPAGTSIDRIDPNGNYEPSNCRWATPVEQQNNLADQKKYTHQGKSLTVAEWARETGIDEVALRARFYRGWPTERALTAVDFSEATTYMIEGTPMTLKEISRHKGIPEGTLRTRLQRGWPLEDMIESTDFTGNNQRHLLRQIGGSRCG